MSTIVGQYTAIGWQELIKKSGDEEYDVRTGIFKAKRTFFGPWEDRFDFILENIIPRAEINDNQLIYYPGAVYPDFQTARATSIRITGHGKGAQEGTFRQVSYDWAQVEVNYDSSLQGESGSDPNDPDFQIITEEFSGSVDVLEIPGEGIVNEADGNAVPEIGKFGKRIPTTVYTYTKHFVINPNFSLYEDKLGEINNVSFVAPSVQKGPKTVLFDSYTGRRAIMLSGVRTWEISSTFLMRKIKWDQMYNKEGDLITVRRRNGGKLFDEGDIHRVLSN